MRRMNLNHIKAAILAELRCFSVGIHDLIDHGHRHLLHLTLGGGFGAGTVGHGAAILLPADAGKAAVLSAVGQLDIGIGAAVVNSLGRLRQSLPDAEGIQLDLLIMGLPGCRMHDRFPVGHHRSSAPGLFFQIRQHFGRHVSLRRDHTGAGRRGNDPVLQPEVSDANGRKQMRVTGTR